MRMRIVLAILLTPLIIPLLLLACIVSAPMILFAFTLAVLGEHDASEWIVEHTPVFLLLDRSM
jgi:hypothetical protein